MTPDLHTLPLGIFTPPGGGHPRVGMRVGADVVDLAPLAALTDSPFTDILAGDSLDPVLAASRPVWESLRDQCLDWVASDAIDKWLTPIDQVGLVLPFTVADYATFTAAGELQHGRAGSVVVSGTTIPRPNGRQLEVGTGVAFVVGVGSELGKPLQPKDFRDHVFGLVAVTEWSISESVVATSLSPWLIPLASVGALDVDLHSTIAGEFLEARSFDALPEELLVKLTAAGASTRTGDLISLLGPSQPLEDGDVVVVSLGAAHPDRVEPLDFGAVTGVGSPAAVEMPDQTNSVR